MTWLFIGLDMELVRDMLVILVYLNLSGVRSLNCRSYFPGASSCGSGAVLSDVWRRVSQSAIDAIDAISSFLEAGGALVWASGWPSCG